MEKFRVETKQVNSDIWNGECEIIETESALEAAVIMRDWIIKHISWHEIFEYGETNVDEIMENVQFRVSNPNDYRWFGKIFNYSDIK